MNDGRVVSQFILQALQDKDIEVFGDGSQTRSFCFVDDLITGIIKLFFSDISEPINLGNPAPISMNELSKEIVALTKSKSKIIYKSLPEDDPKQRQPDISKAISKLGWKPEIDRAEGLVKTIKYFESQLVNLSNKKILD
jgi:nucleoside-diphosphate-sugar epimerase